jgi:phenol hydroxylase P0 protein
MARQIDTMMRENGEGAQRYVRVTGVRNQQFTEFEFSIGDPTLFVELALPFKEFRDFCARNFVQHLTVEQCAEVDFDQLKWRNGDPDFDT